MTTNVPSNSSMTPLLADSTFFGFWAPVSTYSAVNVLTSSNVAGEVSIQFSTTRASVDFEVSIAVAGGEAQTLSQTILAPYFRVKYANDAINQTTFLLWTTLSTAYPTEVAVAVDLDANTSSVAVYGQKPDTTLSALQLDATGNLKTTATLSVEGTLNVSDASSHELLIDLSSAIYEQTNSLLFDLDIIANHGNDASANALATITAIETQTTDLSNALTAVVDGLHDISGSVSVSNQITGFATESTLDAVATTAEDISLQLVVPQRSWVEVDFDTQSSLIVSGAGTWRVPLTGEDGWEYVNTTIGGGTGYFYSNTALVVGGLESDITLGSLTTMWFVGNYRLATEVNPNRRFYLSVYTKPQGAGDFQPWYRSSKTWQLPNSAIVSKGADVFYYAGLDISTIYKEYDHTAYELAVSRGPCASGEVIQFMSFAVDSATPANEFDGIMKHAGFSTAGGTNRVVSYTRASREKIAEDNLKALTVQSGELLVKDPSSVALLEQIADGITVQVGEVDISGVSVVDSKLSVLDVSANLELLTIREILADQINVVNYGLFSADPNTYLPIGVDISGAMLVHVNNPQTVVEISGNVDVSGASFTDSKLNVLDVSANAHLLAIEDILDNGFVNVYDASCELVLDAIKTQTDKLSFYDDGFGAFDLRTSVVNEVAVSVNNTPTVSFSSGSEVGLSAGAQVGLAAGAQVQLVSSEVGITGSVQTHNFASSNGTDWHHLASDANGRIITLSRTHDGVGNDIASTDFGTYRALNVNVSNTTAVPVSASATQYGSYGNLANNVASILPAGVTAGIDVSAWSYFVGAYEDYYNSTPTTGFLRLQYSFDNTTYYDLFNTTVSPSGAGTPRTANFQKQDIPAINWIRFKNDTNGTMTSVTITLLGGSLS